MIKTGRTLFLSQAKQRSLEINLKKKLWQRLEENVFESNRRRSQIPSTGVTRVYGLGSVSIPNNVRSNVTAGRKTLASPD